MKQKALTQLGVFQGAEKGHLLSSWAPHGRHAKDFITRRMEANPAAPSRDQTHSTNWRVSFIICPFGSKARNDQLLLADLSLGQKKEARPVNASWCFLKEELTSFRKSCFPQKRRKFISFRSNFRLVCLQECRKEEWKTRREAWRNKLDRG